MYSELNKLIKKLHEDTQYKVYDKNITFCDNYEMDPLERPNKEEFNTGKIDINEIVGGGLDKNKERFDLETLKEISLDLEKYQK